MKKGAIKIKLFPWRELRIGVDAVVGNYFDLVLGLKVIGAQLRAAEDWIGKFNLFDVMRSDIKGNPSILPTRSTRT